MAVCLSPCRPVGRQTVCPYVINPLSIRKFYLNLFISLVLITKRGNNLDFVKYASKMPPEAH
jgi:hypothetical protein